MLGLIAAQLLFRQTNAGRQLKPVWVDIGGGTGYNIEAMGEYINVDEFFAHIYLVDLSPSLCKVARKRIERLGWTNVTVLCQDARAFRLSDQGADLVTMSYSLSMIPDFYSVVDSITSLLSPNGILGACDFYVQSIVDISSRNYIGGAFNRHVNWVGRWFWRAWFDADRVNLDGGRRDYLEYRFGTILSMSDRNYLLGGIPYYIFVGCQRELSGTSDDLKSQEKVARLDASYTESPYLSPKDYQEALSRNVEDAAPLRSKAYESAIVNLSANLPLPSTFYQNHHRRIFYNDLLPKHQQFNDEYIYAFNWEDPRVDCRLLNIEKDDVILTITSSGDNILDYLLEGPRRVHAVDLNPNQNHLLELKVAAFSALSYADTWKLFGEGRHSDFRNVLINKLSPYMSGHALQYWLNHTKVFTSGEGLYESGGSGLAIKAVRWLFKLFGLTSIVRTFCAVETLNEQREIWPQIRRVLMSPLLHWAVIRTEWWAWKAGGVPPAQRQLIQDDYSAASGQPLTNTVGGQAMWEYVVNTVGRWSPKPTLHSTDRLQLDPVGESTLLSNDNYFYQLCLQGKYSRK
jgi:betaine lipid synthase